jgi:hypothetical protein
MKIEAESILDHALLLWVAAAVFHPFAVAPGLEGEIIMQAKNRNTLSIAVKITNEVSRGFCPHVRPNIGV